MNTWKDGIKEAFKQIYEEKARQLELNWINDYNNAEKWNKAVETREKADYYN